MAISGIEVAHNFTATPLPLAQGIGAYLAADSRVAGFFTLSDVFCAHSNISGVERISSLINRASGSLAFNQATDGRKPALVNTTTLAGVRGAGYFDTVRQDYFSLSGTFNTDAAHSICAIGKYPVLAAARGLIGRNSSATSRNRLGFTSNVPELIFARGGQQAVIPFAYDTGLLAIGSYDGGPHNGTGTIRVGVNRSKSDPVPLTSGDGALATGFVAGGLSASGTGPHGGQDRTYLLLTVDVFATANADLLEGVRELAAVVDGIGV